MVTLTWRVSQGREAAGVVGQEHSEGTVGKERHQGYRHHGRVGSRACSTCAAPGDAALVLHWGIPPHMSPPLSPSSPVCMPMVPMWL